MKPEQVIGQLLESEVEHPNNLELLKKIILTTALGRLQVNGQPPDNQISLGNYLFDNERTLFDVTRLSDNKKNQFYEWLINSHNCEKQINYLSPVSVNEYRGFTAETLLSWWGIIINWIKGLYSEFWHIKELELSLNYQMTGIEICHGKTGSVIGFNQYLVPPSDTKYKDPNDPQREPLGNTKRVFITDSIVDLLTTTSLQQVDFNEFLSTPHPHSIRVVDQQARLKEMHDFRSMWKYLDLKPWYARLWAWICSWFEKPVLPHVAPIQDLKKIDDIDTIRIYERTLTKELIVVENKPDIDNIVFCGGGEKIYGHLGVWIALMEAGVRPRKFAGSSAGAIASLLCYLGYSVEELLKFSKEIKQEHIIHFDIDSQGFSSPKSLKTMLDYMLTKKIMEIVKKYDVPYPKGVITFATLDNLRKQCPGCGIGKELVVTATNKTRRKTSYFSLKHSPDFEVTQAVSVSASLPVLYKPTLINGEEHNDGGILNNFPTEVFSDDNSTLLESELGNDLKLLAIQFDNGTERSTIDKVMDQVYKENFFINWIYRLLTGVEDPASGWEQDRLKLRKYAAQSIIVNFEGIPSVSSLEIDPSIIAKMIERGHLATKEYLKVRHSAKEGMEHKNQEMMYSTFSSLGDLLAYCCYRGNKPWFDRVRTLINESELPDKEALMEQADNLESLYFNEKAVKPFAVKQKSVSFFGATLTMQDSKPQLQYPKLFITLYPMLMKLKSVLVKDKTEKKILEQAIHSLNLDSPWECLEHFAKLKAEVHIIIPIVIETLISLKENPDEKIFKRIENLQHILSFEEELVKPEFYGKWNFEHRDDEPLINAWLKKDWQGAVKICRSRPQGKAFVPLTSSVSTREKEMPEDNFERVLSI